MSAQREIVGIQYLRGIAACAVAFDHSSGMAKLDKYFGQTLWGGWLEKGALGVDLFFMISGFIIAIVSLQRDDARPSLPLLEFARRRVFRIVPMMWIAIVTYAILRLAVGVVADPLSYVRAAFVWPIGDLEPNIIWTLRHEAIFYALFAATFLSKHWLRPLIILWVLAPFAYAATKLSPADPDIAHALFRSLSHPVNVEFGFGLALGLVWVKWFHSKSFQAPLLAASSLAYFLGVVAVGNILDLRADRVPDTLVSATLFTPLMILAVWGCARENRLALLLGNASFSIYLFHSHIVSAALKMWAKIAHTTPIAIVVCTTAIISIAAGIAIHLFLEQPIQKTLANWWRSRRAKKHIAA